MAQNSKRYTTPLRQLPPPIDHRSAPNPYKSRFPPKSTLLPGEEQEWEKQIQKSVICNKFVSINKLIDHIFIQTEKAFRGTKHEQNWMAYHEALSLFVAKELYEYMQMRGFFQHLIVPKNSSVLLLSFKLN